MLVRFSLENYLSFKDLTEFKMAAGLSQRHKSHFVEVADGKRLLKSSFIFGANASGKSSLIKAMRFARDVVLEGAKKGRCNQSYFRIEGDYENKPGFFQFDIYAEEHFYSYGFSISYTTAEITEEWLYNNDQDELCIFERSRDENGVMKVKSDLTFDNDNDKTSFRVYAEAINNEEMKQKTFLFDMAMRGAKEAVLYQPFRDVIRWFSNLLIIYPTTRYGGSLLSNNDKGTSIETLLRHFDTGIESLSEKVKDFDEIFSNINDDSKVSLKDELFKELENEDSKTTVKHNSKRYEFSLHNGSLTTTEPMFNHGNPSDLFEAHNESDGTQRLFDLLPLYRTARFNRVIVIDELDRSLHSKVTEEFIRLFFLETMGCKAQLIATTHDSHVIDLNLLRQDEIWLVERGDDHSSTLKSLSAFRLHEENNAEREYLFGRYGAVPAFDYMALHRSEDELDECK